MDPNLDANDIICSQMIYKSSQSLTTCSFANVTVTVDRVKTQLSKQSSINLTQTFNGHENDYKPPNKTRFRKPQSNSLKHPTFFSPLMHGHVSGLSQSNKVGVNIPLGTLRKHRFMHDSLIEERDNFMKVLDRTRARRMKVELKAASQIQYIWRMNRFMNRACEYKLDKSKAIRMKLWALLAKDTRCEGWAFGAIQRYQLNEQENRRKAEELLLKRKNFMLKQHSRTRPSIAGDITNDLGEEGSNVADGGADGGAGAGGGSGGAGGLRRTMAPNGLKNVNSHSRSTGNVMRNKNQTLTHSKSQSQLISPKPNGHHHQTQTRNSTSKLKRGSLKGTNEIVAGIDEWASNQVKMNKSNSFYQNNIDDMQVKLLESKPEMIEARRLDALATKTKPKYDFEKVDTGLFSSALLLRATSASSPKAKK